MDGTILVTGATGFIGSHVARALVTEGRDVTILCRSFSTTSRISDILDRVRRIDLDRVSLHEALLGYKVAGVVHLATDYSRQEIRAAEVFKANFLLPIELLDLAIAGRAKFFVNTDSFFCKPQFAYPHMPSYTYSKECFLGWALKNTAHIHIASIQLEHVYGPLDGPTKFVPTILAQLMDPAAAEISLTAGRQKRDFVFVADVVDAYMRVIANAETAHPGFVAYEAGTGTSIELRQFVELLRQATRSNSTLVFGAIPYRTGEIMDSQANLSALNALGYCPRTSLEEGIRSLVKAELQSKTIIVN